MTNLSPLVIANKNHTSFHACRHYVSSAFQHAAYKRPRPFINPVHSRYVAFAPASNISSIILQTTLLRTALLDEQMIIWRNGPCRHLCSKPQFLEPRLQRPCALTPDAYPIRKSNLNQTIARSLIHLNNSKTFGSHQFFSTGFQEYVTKNNDSHPSNAKTKNINLPRQQQKMQSKSTNKHKKRKSLTQEEQKRRTLQAISQRLSFFFSDVNLRHDNYARPILEQYNNQYLPLDVIMKFKTIKQLSHDHNEVLQAVNSFSTKAPIKLQIKHESSGEVLIGRSPPFDYEQSLKKSYKKIILAEGWPVDQNTRLVESHFRSMLCVQTDIGVNNSMRSSDYNGAQIPVAFWGKNVAEGVITIEFETEEGAEQAWANLHRAMRSPCVNSAESSHNSDYLAVQSLHLDRNSDGANTTTAGIAKTEHRVHRMKIGDLSLIVRPISVPEANDDLTTNNESTTRVDRCDVETEKATPDINAAMNNDVDISSLFQQNLSTSIPAQSTDTTPTKILDASAPSQSPSLHEGCNSNSWWADGTATPALGDCINAMNELFEVRNTLPPPPREWLHEYTRRTKKGSLQKNKLTQQQHLQRQQRYAICRNVVNLVTCAKKSILEGTIRALGGKEGYLLSDFLGRAMLVYSESPPPPSSSRSNSNGQVSHAEEYIDSYNDRFNVGVGDDISPYEACIDIFHILKKLNLDINPSHYSYAIRAACHESRWEEASNIFLIQIGGGSNDENNSNRNIFNNCNDDGGFVPINPTLGWDQPLQIGLYAVARDAWYKERASEATENAAISPSKQVFDAAMRMCLVSPSGQENCKSSM